MFLHIGGNMVIPIKKIIGIFDFSSNESKITSEYLRTCKEEDFIVYVDKDSQSKSFIVTEREVYFSPIAVSTLKKRSKSDFNINE